MYHYVRQMDNGKWMEVVVEMEIDEETGEEKGNIVDVIVTDEKPDMSKGLVIYEKPMQ